MSELERLLDWWIEHDPDRAERWIEAQLARLALRRRLKALQAAGAAGE